MKTKIKNRLKKILEEKKMTQSELARRSGLNQATISKYVHNKIEMSLVNAYIISRCLGIDTIELIVVERSEKI